jgi:hypothetical protein
MGRMDGWAEKGLGYRHLPRRRVEPTNAKLELRQPMAPRREQEERISGLRRGRPRSRTQTDVSRPVQPRYLGVTAQPRVAKFNALVRHMNKTVYGGGWPTAKAAAIARDRLVLHLGVHKPLNFPKTSRRLGAASPEQLRRQARLLTKQLRKKRFPYYGVTWNERYGRWDTYVTWRGQSVILGRFKDPALAGAVHDRVLMYLRPPDPERRAELLNFPDKRRRPLSPAAARALAVRLHKKTRTSRFRGVYRKQGKRSRPWGARLLRTLGCFRTEREAAMAHDRAARYYLGPTAKLNFPKLAAQLEPANAETLRAQAYRDFKATTRSRFLGVAPTPKGRWCAVLHHRKQRHYLGVFDTQEEAAEAYDEAALRLKRMKIRLNFHPVTGEELCGQWFDF